MIITHAHAKGQKLNGLKIREETDAVASVCLSRWTEATALPPMLTW